MICCKEGCLNLATHQVKLELKANAKDVAATSTPILHVCTQHKNVKLEDVYDENGFNQIRKSFIQQGFFPPSRKHSRVVVEALEKAQ